jgi:ribulose-5-phosphate 4-epimerase/fuculose-1-phosphate aldolase
VKKGLLDGYVGVKFAHERLPQCAPADVATLWPHFRLVGKILGSHGMAPLNGGNMSARLGQGLVVTSSGSNLGILEADELVYVDSAEPGSGRVRYRGPALPSSEAIMHAMVLAARPEAMAVVHAHDAALTPEAMARAGMVITDREEPYGTIALAERALEAFARAEDLIVLENHGYVCVGASLEAVADRIVAMHLRLLQ